MPLAKLRQRAVVRMFVDRQVAECHILMRLRLNLARTVGPRAVAVQQNPHHHLGRIGSLPTPVFFLIGSMDRTEVQGIDHVHQKPRQMLLRQPIMQRGRSQQRLIQIVGPKTLSHSRILSRSTLWKNCDVWCSWRIYSRQTPRQGPDNREKAYKENGGED